jgi:hypothetical protein
MPAAIRPHHLGVDLLAAAIVEGQRDRHDIAFLHRRLEVDQHDVQATRLENRFALGLDVDGRHRAHLHDAALVQVGMQLGDPGSRVIGLEHLDILVAVVLDHHEGAGCRRIGRRQADIGILHRDIVGSTGKTPAENSRLAANRDRCFMVDLLQGCCRYLRMATTT